MAKAGLMNWSTEPALIVGVVEAVLVLLVAFGVPLTTEQRVAVLGVTSAVLAVAGSLLIRSQVSPVNKPPT
jgi:hypothetical protein